MKDYSRVNRLSSQITRELSSLLLDDVRPPSGIMITINEVELSKDLRYGKVFYSVYGDTKAVENGRKFIEANQKVLRRELAGKIRIKFMPELKFEFDPSIEREQRIHDLLNRIKDDEN